MKLSNETVLELLGGKWPQYNGFSFQSVDHWELVGDELVPYDGSDPAPGPNLKLKISLYNMLPVGMVDIGMITAPLYDYDGRKEVKLPNGVQLEFKGSKDCWSITIDEENVVGSEVKVRCDLKVLRCGVQVLQCWDTSIDSLCIKIPMIISRLSALPSWLFEPDTRRQIIGRIIRCEHGNGRVTGFRQDYGVLIVEMPDGSQHQVTLVDSGFSL